MFRLALVAFLCISMSHIPHALAVEAASEKMIATNEVVDTLSRAELEAKVRAQLDRDDLRKELLKLGVSADEAKGRLASLSTSELNQLATQMDQARYGGEVVGLLVVALLVILIIYFAKRI